MGTGLYKKGRFFAAMGIAVFFCIYGTVIKAHAYACSKCLQPMAEICNGDKIEYEAGYHSYGFLLSKKCYMEAKVSTGRYQCICRNEELWKNSDGSPAKHLCAEEHSACSKGYYNVCPF